MSVKDFLVFSGAEFRPHSQLEFRVPFFPNFEKKNQSSKKKSEDLEFHSVNTRTNYMVTFSFNLMKIVCVLASLFFIDQK